MSDFDIQAAADQIGIDLFSSNDSSSENLDATADATTQEAPADQNTSDTPDASAEQDGGQEPSKAVETKQPDDSQALTLDVPKTWRKEASAEWANVPDIVKNEILKREEDMFRGLEGYKQQAAVGQNFTKLLEPFMPYFQAQGVNPYEEIHGLLGFAHTAKFGTMDQKMDMLLAISSDLGIDLLDAAERSASAPSVDPQIKALQAEINQLKSTRQNEIQTQQSQAQQAINAQIEAFANDPANIYFDDVVDDMAQIYNAGMAKTLKEAYDKAVKLNPVASAKEAARLQAEADAQSKAKAAAAEKARAANLRTNARPASATAPVGSIDDTLAQTLREIKARG